MHVTGSGRHGWPRCSAGAVEGIPRRRNARLTELFEAGSLGAQLIFRGLTNGFVYKPLAAIDAVNDPLLDRRRDQVRTSIREFLTISL